MVGHGHAERGMSRKLLGQRGMGPILSLRPYDLRTGLQPHAHTRGTDGMFFRSPEKAETA